ncbi:Eef2k [Symbiodinium sp. CCMP2592]|nr:Eef2k [Symbiodinium sp. CCMP2592]
MAHSLGLVCAMAFWAVLCSARRSNHAWGGWGGSGGQSKDPALQPEDPKTENPEAKAGWVDWEAVAKRAKETGVSMKDAAVGMGIYAKETAEDVPWNDIAEQAKKHGESAYDAAKNVEWGKWAAKAGEWGGYAAGWLADHVPEQPEGGNSGGFAHPDTFPAQAKPGPGFGGKPEVQMPAQSDGGNQNSGGFPPDMFPATGFGDEPAPGFGHPTPPQPDGGKQGHAFGLDMNAGGNAGGFGFPTQGDAGAGGMFPGGGGGFDIGAMQDKINNMAADAMNCAQKEMEVTCKDAELRKNVGVPLWYCFIAIGKRDPGPFPPCEGAPMKIGDASKCKQTEDEIRQAMHEAKEMCYSQIQDLYDLQKELGKCAVNITETKKQVEEDRQPLQDIQQETEECEKTKAKKESEESLGLSSEKEGSTHQFCPAHISEVQAALEKYTVAVGDCISVQVSASVKIPEINIEMPEIKVGQVHSGSFDVEIPKFDAPDFTGDIVVPGGGGKLNVALSAGARQTQGHTESEVKPLTFDQRVANIKSDIQKCEEAKTKVEKTKEEVAGMKTHILQQKEKAHGLERKM